MSTCHEPAHIPLVLERAEKLTNWDTEADHRYCYVLSATRSGSHFATFKTDNRVKCPECRPGRRAGALAQGSRQFESAERLYLTLVRPNRKHRHAITQQLRRKGGSGWYIPILGAFALISDTPLLNRNGQVHSIEIPKADFSRVANRLLDLWRPEKGRMSRPGYHPPLSDKGKPEAVSYGRTNTSYKRHLQQRSIHMIEQGESFETYTYWDEEAHQEALKASAWRPPNDNVDFEPLRIDHDIEPPEEEATG